MAPPLTTEKTTFTRDVLGRYLANTWEEAVQSASTRPFDIVIVGGGSFGSVLAQSLFYRDAQAKKHRILVLEAGLLGAPEHVQNLPVLGLGVPAATSIAELRSRGQDRQPQQELWGLPWHSATRFPGLAYCLGGRSIYFGGWSPRLLPAETADWPAAVLADLNGRFFDEAAEQIGTNQTNDFIFGPLHTALRQQLLDGIQGGQVSSTVPLSELPLHLDEVAAGEEDLSRLEAPLAVETRTRPGCFPINKFSALPLLLKATRVAQGESGGDDAKKRLMVVPDVHVTRLVTEGGRVTRIETQRGALALPEGGVVVLAAATIESARLALLSFPEVPNYDRIGKNLLAHLRSNLTIRIPRTAIAGLAPAVHELAASALFVKGRHTYGDGKVGHFHLQITAAGLDSVGSDSEAELFKKIPDIDTFDKFLHATDTHVVLTLRGIGEMEPQNPASSVRLDPEPDEFGVPRAFVSLAPSAKDRELWDAMDQTADDAALVFAGAEAYEVQTGAGFVPVAAGQPPLSVLGFGPRRDGLGTTHHEAGTLAMGEDPTRSVTDADGRFHHVANAYALCPGLFPSTGSPNPMLTGVALARRMAVHLTSPSPVFAPGGGFTALFDGVDVSKWRMAGEGRFLAAGGILEAVPGNGLGLFWHTVPTPGDFTLILDWMRTREDDNSGVFLRFPNPDGRGYQNTAWVGVHYGFEVQIDERAQPDGAPEHRTGAIYGQPGQTLTPRPALPPGQWNTFEIQVAGQTYTVLLNGEPVSAYTFVPGSDPDPERGLPSASGSPRFVGLQAHTGRVRFRNIRIAG
ncbi:MAG: hypothetical protein QOJ16_3851 [Acidobacteriota bacterium]|jgi:choline dehydrogenase-like flavoprotein|nr:hypothetical protein [Acidobacteriota bacterium]